MTTFPATARLSANSRRVPSLPWFGEFSLAFRCNMPPAHQAWWTGRELERRQRPSLQPLLVGINQPVREFALRWCQHPWSVPGEPHGWLSTVLPGPSRVFRPDMPNHIPPSSGFSFRFSSPLEIDQYGNGRRRWVDFAIDIQRFQVRSSVAPGFASLNQAINHIFPTRRWRRRRQPRRTDQRQPSTAGPGAAAQMLKLDNDACPLAFIPVSRVAPGRPLASPQSASIVSPLHPQRLATPATKATFINTVMTPRINGDQRQHHATRRQYSISASISGGAALRRGLANPRPGT